MRAVGPMGQEHADATMEYAGLGAPPSTVRATTAGGDSGADVLRCR